MRPFLLICSLYLLMPPLQAQPPLLLPGTLPAGELDIAPYTWFFEDLSGDTLALSEIRAQEFRPFEEKRNERTSTARHSRMVTWIRFSLHNTHPTDTLRVYHEVWAHNDITTYENGYQLSRAGLSLSGGMGQGSFPRRPNRFETLLSVPPQQENTYYVRVIDYVLAVTPIISKLTSVQANHERNFETVVAIQPLMTISCALLGCILFMLLYALYSYLITREKVFLYYVFYTLTAALLCFHNIDIRFGLGWLYPYYPVFNAYHPGPLHPALLTIFYGLFVGQILDLRAQLPRHWKVIRLAFGVLALQQGLALSDSFLGQPLFLSNRVYQFGLLPAVLTTVLLMVTAYKSRSLLRNYLLAGMLALFGLSLLPFLFNLWLTDLPYSLDLILNYLPFWILLGLAVEGLCFAMALGKRGQLAELENQRMHQRYTQELKVALEQRTREIEDKNHQLEEQRVHQLERMFEQRLAETAMGTLRAQMNPHFIFNCLNSIKLYATDNESGKAAEYLTKFSRLIRLVLENSRSEKVTLQKELEALRLYLEMEAMRFKDKLSFTFTLEDHVDPDFIEIPPLLIQPYVENAIWHGLMQKEEGGALHLRIAQTGDYLLRVTVTDDGIGREKAALLKSKSATPRKSFGMAVTSERIHLINQLYQTETKVQIMDLVDSQGQAAGTEVILEIPI